MRLKSLEGCRLKIGSYPAFLYNACGGGGLGTLRLGEKNNLLYVSFSSQTFSIPSLTSKTTKFLFLPLPLGIKIKMSMERLEGTIDKNSGEILLEFESRFILRIGSIFNFPDLLVKTSLKTGKVKSYLYEEEGLVRQENGKSKLVGVSMIPITGHKLLDTFLGLPNEALAILECEIKEY